MTDNPALSASLEDYLEAIYNIIREKQAVRVKDIAKRLKVSNASVTGALRALSKRNFLNYAPYDVITLTPKGEAIAREIVRRHQILKDFFVKVLSIDPAQADEAACRLEHGVSPEIIDRLVHFIEFIEICPLGGEKLIQGFKKHLECGIQKDKCNSCIELARTMAIDAPSAQKKISTLSLAELEKGQRAMIKRLKTKGPLKKRLTEMGLVPGAVVEVIRVAPAGDPVEVKVRGYYLSLRKDEVEKVEVVKTT